MPLSSESIFLSSLTAKSRSILLGRATTVDLPLGTALYKPDQRPHYAYFLTSGIASVVTSMPNGATVEVGLIGREGIVGAFHLLGRLGIPTRCFIQLKGAGIKIKFSDLQTAFKSSEEIREYILEFVQEQALSVSQLAACQRLHDAEARLARWLLMAQDRTQSDTLSFTQELLAMMLGSQRTTVTMVAGALQRRGLIKYRRGVVRILNRELLEQAACDCYPVMKRLYDSLYREAALSQAI
jgi:CRP-like cAMP-binding protein